MPSKYFNRPLSITVYYGVQARAYSSEREPFFQQEHVVTWTLAFVDWRKNRALGACLKQRTDYSHSLYNVYNGCPAWRNPFSLDGIYLAVGTTSDIRHRTMNTKQGRFSHMLWLVNGRTARYDEWHMKQKSVHISQVESLHRNIF